MTPSTTSGFVGSLRVALRPTPAPPAVLGALCALLAAGCIVGAGAVFGDLASMGVAFLGAACAIAYAGVGPFRTQTIALLAQAFGAVVGIALGVLLPTSAPVLIATAALAGAVSGWLGGIGPNAPAFGMMLAVGLAFGQFGGSKLSWWQQDLWFLLGTVLVAVTALLPTLLRRQQSRRQAAADVLDAAADLCEAVGADNAHDMRLRLAAASATARGSGSFPAAELSAFAAAACYAEQRSVGPDVVFAIRKAAEQVRAGRPIDVDLHASDDDSVGQAFVDALSPTPQRAAAPIHADVGSMIRSLRRRPALASAARMALCMGVATAVPALLDRPEHAFWIPLTVAVIVRPEYASIYVRTINRIVGTVIGAILAALVLQAHPTGAVIAAVTAGALALAKLTASKLYAFYVTGATAATLLSASLGHDAPILAGLRVLDTVVGAAIAVVCGYLLWPGARRLPSVAHIDAARRALDAYLLKAGKPAPQRIRWQSRRDDAYRLAHLARSSSEAALAEPPPVSHAALQAIPIAVELEEIADQVTAVAAAVDAGINQSGRIDDIRRRLDTPTPTTRLTL